MSGGTRLDPDLPEDQAARLRGRDRKVARPRMIVDNAGVKRLLLQRGQGAPRGARRRKKRR